MYKALTLRHETMGISSHSAITRMQIFRLVLVIIVYTLISMGSAIALLLIDTDRFLSPGIDARMNDRLSPWKPEFDLNASDMIMQYYLAARWPNLLTFLPPFIGLGIFLMYGFGTPVRRAMTQLSIYVERHFCRPKRKMSTVKKEDADVDIETLQEGSLQRRLSLVQEADELEDNQPIIEDPPAHNQRRRVTAPTLYAHTTGTQS